MKRLLLTVVVSGLAAGVGPTLVAGPAHAAPQATGDVIPLYGTQGTYVATTPTRVLDTRTTRQLTPGESTTVPVTGRAGVPATGVSAVVVNLTATRAAAAGYLTAYPSTSSAGGTSSVIFAKGDSRASLVTVPVGSDGSIKVLDGGGSGAGPVDAVVDVQGYYQDGTSGLNQSGGSLYGASFQAQKPTRLLDTRTSGGAVQPNGTLKVTVDQTGIPEESPLPTALAVNITAASPTAAGYLTAWDGASARPATSNVNFVRGRSTPNNAIVPLDHSAGGSTSSFSIFNGGASTTNVVVDVVGAYYEGPFGLRFQPLATPQRIVNTTTGAGTTKLGAGTTRTVTTPSSLLSPHDGTGGYFDGGTDELVGTLTAVRPSANTFLTAWATGEDRPSVSNLNPYAGQTVANHAFVPLSSDGQFDLYNYLGSTDVLVDVVGRFDAPVFDFSVLSSQKASALRAQARAAGARGPATVSKVTRTAG